LSPSTFGACKSRSLVASRTYYGLSPSLVIWNADHGTATFVSPSPRKPPTLDFLGYAAVPAESGGEALRLIASELEIDLVLADFAMPEMNGVELVRAIDATQPTLPVILVTGYSDLEALREFDKSQILQKPYTEGDLVDKIRAALT
jgi:CheY-like chemotaxis protein